MQSGKCPYLDNCTFAHGKDDLRKAMCKFGTRCRNRSNCWYEHPPQEEEEPSASSSPVDGATVTPNSSSSPTHKVLPPNYRMSMCRNWQNNVAGCPYGDHCNFAHGRDQLRSHVLECGYGADCPHRQLCQYSHPETQVCCVKIFFPIEKDYRAPRLQ